MSGAGLDDRAVERLLTGTGPGDADLERAVTLVRSLATGPAPEPTAALAQFLDEGFEPEVVPVRRATSRRTWAARAGAAFTAAAASLVLAGTAQALPPAVQDGLADLVAAVTPFELPRSDAPDPAGTPAPAGDPTRPAVPALPTPASPTSSAPTPGSSTDEREDEREDAVAEDGIDAERQERDGQRVAEEAAEESAEAEAEATADAADRSEDAARASESAAREAARASQKAAEESAEQAERDAKDAEDAAEDAAKDAEDAED